MNRKLRSITKRVLASNLRLYKNRPKNHNMTLLFYNEIALVFHSFKMQISQVQSQFSRFLPIFLFQMFMST